VSRIGSRTFNKAVCQSALAFWRSLTVGLAPHLCVFLVKTLRFLVMIIPPRRKWIESSLTTHWKAENQCYNFYTDTYRKFLLQYKVMSQSLWHPMIFWQGIDTDWTFWPGWWGVPAQMILPNSCSSDSEENFGILGLAFDNKLTELWPFYSWKVVIFLRPQNLC
jgi:hypothetical protein